MFSQSGVENQSGSQATKKVVQAAEFDDSIEKLMQEEAVQQSNSQSPQQRSVSNVKNLQRFLKDEYGKLKRKVRKHINYILKNKKDNYSDFCKQDVLRCFYMFQEGCENILNTFFGIAANEDYLVFETENSLTQKIDSIKSQLDRSALHLVKRLNKSKRQLQEQQSKKKQSIKMKGKNCKTSTQATVILQKWLLNNFHDPYPSQKQRQVLSRQSNLSIYQVNNWLINTREKIIRRYLKKQTKMSGNNGNASTNNNGNSQQCQQIKDSDQQ